jgi:hypothetical protein
MPSVYDYALEEFKRWSPEILTRFTKSPNGRQVYNKDPIDEYSPVLIVEFPLVYVRAETFSSIFLMLCNEDFWDKKWGELEASGLDVVDAILTVQDNPLLSAISYVDISHVWENGMSDLEGYLIDILPSAGYCHMLRTFPTYLGMVKGYRERPETLANDMLVSFEDISGIGQVRQMAIKDVVEGSNG